MRHFIFAGLVGALARAAALALAVVPLVSQRVGSVAATCVWAPTDTARNAPRSQPRRPTIKVPRIVQHTPKGRGSCRRPMIRRPRRRLSGCRVPGQGGRPEVGDDGHGGKMYGPGHSSATRPRAGR